ncbi:unnamed protein product [Orchesella dallaii]|uniref:Uncharacterized protein n=1 Tax=Orchesella dallaii TaxID=48710 RepID=A0ABP1RL08_9HEXA
MDSSDSSLTSEDLLDAFLRELNEDHDATKENRCWDFPWSSDEWENVDDPDCFLCGEECLESTSFNRSFASQKLGFLQCSYCFNFFHRHNCILSLSDKMYYEYKCSRSWSCPTCIPEFRMNEIEVTFNVNFRILLSIFKAMYHLSNFFGHSPFYGIVELLLCLHGLFYAFIWSIDVG